MRKRHILHVAVIFFGLLAVLTFLSRTIYRRMMPIVEVTGVGGGTLKYAYTADDILISGDDSAPEMLPVLLARPLTITKIHVRPNQHVAAGDALVDFHAQDGEYLLREARRKLDLATAARKAWQSGRNNRVADLAASMQKPDADVARLQRELSLLNEGIMDGTTDAQLTADVTEWGETLAALEELRRADWQLRAAVGGYVEAIEARQGDEYAGLSPIATICPDGADYRVGCVWKGAPSVRPAEWIIRAAIPNAGPLEAVDIEGEEDETTLWFERGADTPPPDQITEMRLSADSPYCPMLVKNGAFDGDTLYLLKSRIGAWGQVEYYAKEARVIRGTGDGRFTSVLSGLDYGDVPITSWSKPIRDGDPVLLSSYE